MWLAEITVFFWGGCFFFIFVYLYSTPNQTLKFITKMASSKILSLSAVIDKEVIKVRLTNRVHFVLLTNRFHSHIFHLQQRLK